MAKKPNYDFEKRRKEQDRKQKKDAKREERLLRKRSGEGAADETEASGDDEAIADADKPPAELE